MNQSSLQPFQRDRLTWEAYILLGYYGYLLNSLGPITPFLKAKLEISYTLASFHFSAFATGMILAGLAGDLLVRHLGRGHAVWLGGLGMAAGVLLLAAGNHPAVTIGASLMMGALGTLLLMLVPSILADRHGQLQVIALAEANVVSSFFSAIAPVLVGISAAWLGDWRPPLLLAVAALGLIYLIFRSVTIPAVQIQVAGPSQTNARLPARYWLLWIVLVLVVSVEFCMAFWGADYLEKEIGLSRPAAASTLSLFLWGMTASRWIGSRLVRRVSGDRLIIGALLLSGVGFFLYWGFSAPELAIVGLFVSGLGVANLYPLTLSQALAVAPENSNLAGARAAFASGTAILLLPLLLGGLADQVGIRLAYGVVALLLVLALGFFWLAKSQSNQGLF